MFDEKTITALRSIGKFNFETADFKDKIKFLEIIKYYYTYKTYRYKRSYFQALF